MTDKVSLAIVQERNDKIIFDLTGNWYELEDFAANKMSMDIVGAVVQLAAEWDKALTGGVPAKKWERQE